MKNAINWFELPAINFGRAVKFYSEVLAAELQQFDHGPIKMAFFPHAQEGVGGAIACGEGYKPQAEGPIIYFNGGDDLSTPLARVEPAGGKVVMPKQPSAKTDSSRCSWIPKATGLPCIPWPDECQKRLDSSMSETGLESYSTFGSCLNSILQFCYASFPDTHRLFFRP